MSNLKHKDDQAFSASAVSFRVSYRYPRVFNVLLALNLDVQFATIQERSKCKEIRVLIAPKLQGRENTVDRHFRNAQRLEN